MRFRIDAEELRPGDKLPAEYDLAREFGVAYMTVRAALDNLVNEGILRRVHGKGTFVENRLVPDGANGTLALVLPSLSLLWNNVGLHYFPSIAQGFCAEATNLGYEPTVIGGYRKLVATEENARPLGVAYLLSSVEDTRTVDHLTDAKLPSVTISRYNGGRSISYVSSDQAGGVSKAVELLAQMGHKKIAFLSGPVGNLGAQERLRGFQRGMSAHGFRAAGPVDLEPRDYTEHSGLIRTEKLLARRNPPTAIVAAGDLIAAGAVQAIHQAGLNVPDDISVVGFGDFQIARYVKPGLTTVHLPLAELGAAAANLLHGHISGKVSREAVHLDTGLVIRKSTAPPGMMN